LIWVNAIVQGILLGGLYALLASGLSLTFGVMRIVNLAHGDLLVLAAFLAWSTRAATGWNTFVTLLVVLPGAFLAGLVLQRIVLDRLVNVDPAFQIVATFGLAVVIANAMLLHYSATQKRLGVGHFDEGSIHVAPHIDVGWLSLLTFGVAVALLSSLSLFLGHTKLGRAFRATADDPTTARLMGIDHRQIYAIAAGIALVTAGVGGVFLGIRTQFQPSSGPTELIYAFEAVVIGGLGSLWGTLAGGVLLGVAQTTGDQWRIGWFQIAGHLLFLTVLVFRPTGLFGREAR
jgi:branched-chain amino acid transport system permease protein